MATKKDLVEAYSFSRRRLVTAFISGAPGGREVEPARPGRTIVGGLALAVLLIAGAAIAGIFAPRAPDDWASQGLVLSKEDGNAYVILEDEGDPVLRPVINITSAKLILGADSEPRSVPQEEIDERVVGDDIGIFGAPATVPSASLLIPTGWTACTDEDRGVRVTITEQPGVDPDVRGAFVVLHEGRYYVIAVSGKEDDQEPRGYSYLLPKDASARDNILDELGLVSAADSAVEVGEEWLTLFPEGADLELASFGLEGLGTTPAKRGEGTGIPDDAVIGNVLESSGDYYVVTLEGPMPLTDFAAAVYRNLPEQPSEVAAEGPLEARPESTYSGNHWPTDLPHLIDQAPCAVLHAEEDQPPAVVPGSLVDEQPDVPAPASSVVAGQKDQGVQPGHGAYVLSGSFTDSDEGLPFLIDAKGKAYTLVGSDAADLLGYGSAEHPVVPDEWVELFEPGVPLSRDAALCRPREDPDATC